MRILSTLRAAALVVLACAPFSQSALAQSAYPNKPIRMIVPFAPGGASDIVARIIAPKLADVLGQQLVVENRSGASGNIGMELAAGAAADGYTLFLGNIGTIAINPAIYRSLTVNPAKDFIPVAQVADVPSVLIANTDFPANNVAELIAHLKANPDKLSYGSSGAGTSIHLAAELFKIKTGTTMTHVPFRSSGDIMNNLTGGHINLAFDNITLAWPQVKAGRLRALAVSSTERSAIAPDVPTVADTIPGFEATSWHGVFAPAGTPKPIVDKMAAEMKRILELPDVKDKLFEIGAVASPMTPEDFGKFIDGERAKWADVVKASGAKMD